MSAYLVPLAPFVTSIGLYAAALRRPSCLWLVPLAACHVLSLYGATAWSRDGADSLWGLLVCIWASQSVSTLYLEDHATLLVDGRRPLDSLPWMAKFAATWNNPRLVGTSKGQRPGGSAPLIETKSRGAFAILCLAKLAVYWVLNRHFVPRFVIPGPFVPLDLADFDDQRQVLFRRLLLLSLPTGRELSIRLVFSFFWALGAYIMVDGAHVLLALVFVVVLRLDRPSDWRPIYGSLRDVRGLRSFWGRFWHRLVVVPYGNVGRLCLPGLSPSSWVAKAAVAFAIFFLSGASHALVAWRLDGANSLWYLDIWWFSLNFVACAIEGVVAAWLSKMARRQGGWLRALAESSVASQFLGCLWLFAFFFWSVPKWQYPKVHALIVEMIRTGSSE